MASFDTNNCLTKLFKVKCLKYSNCISMLRWRQACIPLSDSHFKGSASIDILVKITVYGEEKRIIYCSVIIREPSHSQETFLKAATFCMGCMLCINWHMDSLEQGNVFTPRNAVLMLGILWGIVNLCLGSYKINR